MFVSAGCPFRVTGACQVLIDLAYCRNGPPARWPAKAALIASAGMGRFQARMQIVPPARFTFVMKNSAPAPQAADQALASHRPSDHAALYGGRRVLDCSESPVPTSISAVSIFPASCISGPSPVVHIAAVKRHDGRLPRTCRVRKGSRWLAFSALGARCAFVWQSNSAYARGFSIGLVVRGAKP